MHDGARAISWPPYDHVGVGQGQAWSTLDLGRRGDASWASATADAWANSSHQGLTAAAPEPSRGLSLKAGDAVGCPILSPKPLGAPCRAADARGPGGQVGWRLLFRQALYEIYFAPPAPAGANSHRPQSHYHIRLHMFNTYSNYLGNIQGGA
jgi:hypothetical protein